MSRIQDVIQRYNACRSVLEHGVDVFAVGDPTGAHLNAMVRRAVNQVDEGNSDVWADLIRASNAVRWRRVTQPQPNADSPAIREAIAGVLCEAKRLRDFVADESLVDRIAAAATTVGDTDSPVGAELLRAITETGVERCVVIASNDAARAGLNGWLKRFGVVVVVPRELDGLAGVFEHAYVVGPPTFFPVSLVAAPTTRAITFVAPAWFGNRSLPTSSLAAHAEDGTAISVKVRLIGDVTGPGSEASEEVEIEEDTFYPEPVWGRRRSEDREPGRDEVEARKILLGGGLALWLDDGERIRSLDPRQPEGDRVSYEAVRDVQPGTYLVLREGANERGAMYDAALAAVGQRAASITQTQERWKQALADRLTRNGAKQVIAVLEARNIRSARRVRAWIEPTLICPKHEEDLAKLLEWLEIPLHPTYTNAVHLRRALYKASADLRHELEGAVGQADLLALERDGFMHLEIQRTGFRGMIVARVLARAPFTEIVQRPQTRVPFPDPGAQWLE
ncbi:DISARM anti-phage system protein DrmE domain-containing protein [Rhodococcus koreensis]